MSHQTMLQIQAKYDSRLTDAAGFDFEVPKGTIMLLGIQWNHDSMFVRVVTGNAMSHKLKLDVTDLEYRDMDDTIVIEMTGFQVLSDNLTRLRFVRLLDHVRFHERLVREVPCGQML